MYQVKFTCGQKWTACLTEQESYFQSKLEAADKMNYTTIFSQRLHVCNPKWPSLQCSYLIFEAWTHCSELSYRECVCLTLLTPMLYLIPGNWMRLTMRIVCLHNSHCTLRSCTNLFCDIWVHSVVCLPLFLSCINIKTSTSSKIITIIFAFNATWSYENQEFHVTCLPTLLIGKKTQLPKLVSSFHSHGKCSIELISPHSN